MALLFFLLLIQAVTGQQLSRVMHGVNLKRSHSFLNHPPAPEILALWIDGKQIENITGIFMEVDIIRRGIVNYQLDSIQLHELPTLPHYVDHVELTWLAEKETFRYSFSKMISLNPDILWDPLLSIPSTGNVPRHQSVFEIAIPCTKNKTGVASLYVELNITNSMYQPIPGSPLQLRIKKKCFGNNDSCHCKNGGRCMNGGLCRCPSDSYGERCQFKTGRCGYSCKNGGVCNHLHSCSCPEGYVGKFCQIPVCRQDCGLNGLCVAPETCDCKPWFRGPNCSIKSHTYNERKKTSIHKKTRKQRQSDATQKDTSGKSWKGMKKGLALTQRSAPHQNNVLYRHPNRKSRKKIKIFTGDYNRLRRNHNRYNYKKNYQNYRQRSGYDRSYNYNHHPNQNMKRRRLAMKFNSNIHKSNFHKINMHKKRMKPQSLMNNLQDTRSNTDIHNKVYADEYKKKGTYELRYKNQLVGTNKMRLKVKRIRRKNMTKKGGVLRMNNVGKSVQSKNKRKVKSSNSADISLNVKSASKKKSIKKRRHGQVRNTEINYDKKLKKANSQLYVNGRKSKRGNKMTLRKNKMGRLVRQVLRNDRA